jgi:hypothetical protein
MWGILIFQKVRWTNEINMLVIYVLNFLNRKIGNVNIGLQNTDIYIYL